MDIGQVIFSPTIIMLVGINAITGLGLYLTITTGQFSLGHAAFMAIGAYTSAVMTVKLHLPLVPALLIAAVAASLVGVVFGLPALRTRGTYLAVITLGLGELVRVFFSSVEFVGGVSGMNGMRGTTPELVVITLVICTILVKWLMDTPVGRAFEAIGQDQVVAESIGINATRLKVLAFALGAALAGIGGALYAHLMFFIEPPMFDYNYSVLILLFVIFGGMESLWGAILGAAILTPLPELVRGLDHWRMLIYGAILVIMMAFRSQGLLSKQSLRQMKKFFQRERKTPVQPEQVGVRADKDKG